MNGFYFFKSNNFYSTDQIHVYVKNSFVFISPTINDYCIMILYCGPIHDPGGMINIMTNNRYIVIHYSSIATLIASAISKAR